MSSVVRVIAVDGRAPREVLSDVRRSLQKGEDPKVLLKVLDRLDPRNESDKTTRQKLELQFEGIDWTRLEQLRTEVSSKVPKEASVASSNGNGVNVTEFASRKGLYELTGRLERLTDEYDRLIEELGSRSPQVTASEAQVRLEEGTQLLHISDTVLKSPAVLESFREDVDGRFEAHKNQVKRNEKGRERDGKKSKERNGSSDSQPSPMQKQARMQQKLDEAHQGLQTLYDRLKRVIERSSQPAGGEGFLVAANNL